MNESWCGVPGCNRPGCQNGKDRQVRIEIISEDGEVINECTLDEFLAANASDADWIAEIEPTLRGLIPGESTYWIGGGASAAFRIERTDDGS